MTFAAVWEPTYTVTFDFNGGNWGYFHKTVTNGDTVGKPAIKPKKTDHLFNYWALSTDLTQEYNWNTPVTKDITLVAVWRPG